MALLEAGQNNQKTRDEIGQGSSTFPRIIRKDEEISIEEGPHIVETETIGHSWIVGSSTNGLVGTNTATQDGQQQVVGGAGRVNTTNSVTNINNKFIERFGFDYFEDSGTATWDTTNQELAFTTGQIAQSLSCFKNSINIINATFTCNFDTGDSSDVTVQLSSDGGSNWETVTIGTKHNFSDVGQDLRFKITASDTVKITWIKIQYNN